MRWFHGHSTQSASQQPPKKNANERKRVKRASLFMLTESFLGGGLRFFAAFSYSVNSDVQTIVRSAIEILFWEECLQESGYFLETSWQFITFIEFKLRCNASVWDQSAFRYIAEERNDFIAIKYSCGDSLDLVMILFGCSSRLRRYAFDLCNLESNNIFR